MNKYLNFCKKCMDGKMDQTKITMSWTVMTILEEIKIITM